MCLAALEFRTHLPLYKHGIERSVLFKVPSEMLQFRKEFCFAVQCNYACPQNVPILYNTVAEIHRTRIQAQGFHVISVMVKVKFKNTCKSNQTTFIAIWKKHVSTKQLLKFIPNQKTLLYELLKDSPEGLICLKYFKKIKNSHSRRDNDMFSITVEQLGKHLERFPTLIPCFPMALLQNIKRIRKASMNKRQNVIHLTKHHLLNCAMCDEKVVGNKSKTLMCKCATRFYHKQCYAKTPLACEVCLYVYNKQF